MVAEKPSVARLVAECLWGEGRGDRVRERRGLAAACPVLEFVAVARLVEKDRRES